MIFDVAIIGGGFAGLTVANRVAEAGLRPVVLEAGADDLYMCNSRVATGALHVSFLSPEEPADTLYEAILRGAGGTARPDLARALADRSAGTIAWMRGLGVEFEAHPRRINGVPMMAPLRRMTAGLDWEESGPNLFLQILEARLRQRGGELRRGCRVTRIRTGNGRVSGVDVDRAGRTETVAARNVVVADGGFQADPDLVAAHIAPNAAALQQRNTGTGRGDGLRMATEIGAATVGLDRFYGHVLSRDAMTDDRLWPYPQLDVICAKGIAVTPDGRRFADEGLGGICLTNAIAALDDPLSATAVFDSTVWEDARATDNVPPNPSLPDNGGTVIEAASLAGLARKAGLDGARLAATVAAFNESLETGKAGDLSPARTTGVHVPHPVARPPFYAVPLCAGLTVTSGGLAIDAQARVLDSEGEPIPGLYAAGSSAGGLEGGPQVGYVGGLIKAFCLGLIAGDAIAAG